MFCTILSNENLGIGKILEINNNDYKVSYFTLPSSPLKEITVSKSDVKPLKLGRNQRVFYNYDIALNKWKVGIILEHLVDQDKLYVQFPNKECIYIDINEEIFVKSSIDLGDPTSLLANQITETPFFTVNRCKFFREYINQRNSSQGMSAYLSSNIFLEEHQYNVVSKILSDPFQRYLLADEVGLGKTIEAGILIKQNILDNPKSKVLIITPDLLTKQWENELNIRFNIMNSNNIKIIGYKELSNLKQEKFSMVVIDEAHNLVKNVDENNISKDFKILQLLTKNIRSLLILSATPALGNEKSFLAMLNILDPILYSLNSLETFKLKISNRQSIGSIVSQLNPESILFIPEQLSELKDQFKNDSHLIELSDKLLEVIYRYPEENDPELVQSIDDLRNHISEVYKLDRRILRNRRKKYEYLTLDREGCEFLYYEDLYPKYIINSLENWRLGSLSELSKDDKKRDELADIFFIYLNSFFTDIEKLEEYIDIRLNKSKNDVYNNDINILATVDYFYDEENFLKEIKENIELDKKYNEKIKHLISYIKKIIEKENIIIFCSSDINCKKIYNELNKVYFDNVLIYKSDLQENSFLSSSKRIFICNSDAEEGLNLQHTRASIIHYDLPLNPNRIEQRIGRLDRYGAKEGVKSYLLVNKEVFYETSWAKCLNEGFCVFNSSIASLQYLVDEEITNLKKNLISEGHETIDDLIISLIGSEGKKGRIQDEIKKIDVSDLLNEMTMIDKKDAFEKLEDVENYKNIAQSFLPLIKKSYKLDTIEAGQESVFRFKYNYNRITGNSLILLSDFSRYFKDSWCRFDGEYSVITKPFSFERREKVINSNTELLRYGSPFIESLYKYLKNDERGLSFALWRYHPKYESVDQNMIDVFFKFDFLIEVNLEYVFDYCKELENKTFKISLDNLKRLSEEVLPAFFETIWLDIHGNIIEQDFIDIFLEREYSKTKREDNSFDKNIKPEIWKGLNELNLSFLESWDDTCFYLRKEAEKLLLQSDKVKKINNIIKHNKKIDQEHIIQRAARISNLEFLFPNDALIEKERMEIDKIIKEKIYEGCLKPKVSLDSLGSIFLSKFVLKEEN